MIRRRKGMWAILGMLLALCVQGTYPIAFAHAGQGSITISKQQGDGAIYDAYLVFRSQVSEGGQATRVSWPSSEAQEVVLSFLDTQGYDTWLESLHPGSAQHDRAQNALEFVSTMIGDSVTVGTAEPSLPTPVGTSFATGLARAIAISELAPTMRVTAGQRQDAPSGYWLLVTNQESLASRNEAGTAPLWLAVGVGDVDIVEKASVPTIAFEVMEDSTRLWGRVADSNRGQDLPYRVTGTLPSNYAAFDQYHYRFVISLPKGVDLALDGAEDLDEVLDVTVAGIEAPIDQTNVCASYEESTIVVDFPDLHSDHWSSYGIDEGSVITVEYLAHLGGEAAVGMPGNTSEACLVYSADPVTLAESGTPDIPVTVFSYQLMLLKADSDSDEPLPGASFSLRAQTEGSEAEQRYVQEDGSLGTPIHTFMTGDDGMVTIAGLDEGSYAISEVVTPDGYQRLESDIDITITTTLSDLDRTISSITLQDDATQPVETFDIQPEVGSISLRIENDKLAANPHHSIERLPQTGIGPIAEVLIAAGLIIAGFSAIRRRN